MESLERDTVLCPASGMVLFDLFSCFGRTVAVIAVVFQRIGT